MHKILITKAFIKAEKELKEKGENKPSLTLIAEHISEYVLQETGFEIGGRRYRDYLNDAKKIAGSDNEDIRIAQMKVINGLCKYLKCDTYQQFVEENCPKKATISLGKQYQEIIKKIMGFKRKIRIQIFLALAIISMVIFYNSLQGKRWMVWDKNQYKEVAFNLQKYDFLELKKYDQNLMDSFKKIDRPDCNGEYLNKDRTAKTWYWKKNNEEIEVYTAPGLHPTNGVTLKPITTYMIRKYICPD